MNIARMLHEYACSKLPSFVSCYAGGPVATEPTTATQFIDRFVETWRKLPVEDREMITRGLERLGNPKLRLQLRDNHQNLARGPSGDATAQLNVCRIDGAEIIFKSTVSKGLSESICRYWIAHELAHLFLAVQNADHMSDQNAEEEVEELLIRRWGFDKNDAAKLNAEVYLIARSSGEAQSDE